LLAGRRQNKHRPFQKHFGIGIFFKIAGLKLKVGVINFAEGQDYLRCCSRLFCALTEKQSAQSASKGKSLFIVI